MNWTNLLAAGGLGLLVGALVYLIGSVMDRARDRRWHRGAEQAERSMTPEAARVYLAHPPLPRRSPGQSLGEHDTDGA